MPSTIRALDSEAKSIAVDFAGTTPDNGVTNSIQLGVNGQLGATVYLLANSGINLSNAGTYSVHIQYDGAILYVTLTDLSSMKSETVQFTLNIPAILGGGLAYAGLTAGSPTAGDSSRIDVLGWSYANGGTYTAPSPNLTSLSDADIGSPPVKGSANYSGGTYNMSGSGSIGGTADKFNYDSTSWTGDGILTAEVTKENIVDNNGQAGIMFRDSNANNAIMAAFIATPAKGAEFVFRTTLGGTATTAFSYGAQLDAYELGKSHRHPVVETRARRQLRGCLLFNRCFQLAPGGDYRGDLLQQSDDPRRPLRRQWLRQRRHRRDAYQCLAGAAAPARRT